MFLPESIPRAAIAASASSAVRRSLTSPESISSTSNMLLRARSAVFAEGSGPVDYFFASIVFISIPITVIGHIMLYRKMNKLGRDSLVGTPFAPNELEKGFTLSQVASMAGTQIRHLLSFGSRRDRSNSDSASQFTNSIGVTSSTFAMVGNADSISKNGKGPILPVVAPTTPLSVPPMAASSTVTSTTEPTRRPLSPTGIFVPANRNNVFRPPASHGNARTGGGISVTTSTHTYGDSVDADAMELSEVVEIRPKGPFYADPSTGALERADIKVSDAISVDGSSAVSDRVATKAKEGKNAPSTWVLSPMMDKVLPSVPGRTVPRI